MTDIIKNINTAVDELKSGNLIALPAETVYGLAANALNPEAVIKIYEVKERPGFNPLIVHVHDKDEINKYAVEIPETAYKIFDKFSPGPVTVILKKKNIIPPIVTAGLDTVALRVPGQEHFRAILKEAGLPVSAPSANRSGKISPTTAEEVLKELDGRINYIFDGGKCNIGIESTVVSVEGGKINILRPGYITLEDLKTITPHVSFAGEEKIISPGLMKFHYEPETPLYIAEDEQAFAVSNGSGGVLNPLAYSSLKDLAINLYSELRSLDEKGYKYILTARVKNEGIGIAINDRLEKAARGFASVKNGELQITAK